jgi:2-oxoglutarate/2-oxoacid ferredoxin oxidoreductase subunit beta
MSATALIQDLGYTKKDFVSDQDVRWCPGCGDYAILAQVQKVMPELGIEREKIVFISGIGCSSRFPYYMNTYGFHTIHGRAPAIATGLKLTRPDLSVWVVTGDGDALSIGANHFVQTLRRNVDLKILLFNNRIYGLTKGQYSPTSELGLVTKSSPGGVVARPFSAPFLALGAQATFVARSIDTETQHLQEMIQRVAQHRGTAFLEIYQNCPVFNDGTFDGLKERSTKADNLLFLKDGQPLAFGQNGDRVLKLDPISQKLFASKAEEDDGGVVMVHREATESPTLAGLLAQHPAPGMPTPLGVFRCVPDRNFDADLRAQRDSEIERNGPGTLAELLDAGDRWTL